MRKITLSFLMILFIIPAPAKAVDFVDSVRTMQVAIRRALRFDSTSTGGLSDVATNSFIEEGLVAVVPLIRARKAVDSFTTTFRQSTYSLDSTTLGIISVRWSKNDTVKILRHVLMENWERAWLELKSAKSQGTTSGKESPFDRRVSFYDYTDDDIYLFPTPTIPNGDTIKIISWKKAASVGTITDLSSIPTQYRLSIYLYALWRSSKSLGLPLTDSYFEDYIKSVNNINATLNNKGPQVATPNN